MARRKLIAANWKMYKTAEEGVAFARELKQSLGRLAECDMILFPPFLALPDVARELEGTPVATGAQDLFWEAEGAFTGEVAGGMITAAGASFVLVGHSERRTIMGESDEIVAKKLKAALAADLRVILCVGEQLAERESGRAEQVVERQLSTALADLDTSSAQGLVIAYEPVWAIGTGRTATPEDAEEMHRFIREYYSNRFGSEAAALLRIQYGGSVKPSNAASLLGREEIDGALIGGASLEADSFTAIAVAAAR